MLWPVYTLCLLLLSSWFLSTYSSVLECQEEADIVFMVDSSVSIREYNPQDGSQDNWRLMKEFVVDLVRELPLDKIKIGALTFATEVHLDSIVYLDNGQTKEDLLAAINDLPYLEGNTNTSGALRTMDDIIFQESRGDRPGVRNIGILITDGLSNVDDHLTASAARDAKLSGIRIFTVGVSMFVDREELQEISSDPVAFYFLSADEFVHLPLLKDQLLGSLCRVKPPPPTPCENAHGDIAFILDDSGSIKDKNPENSTGNYNWELLISFVIQMVNSLDVGLNRTRVSVIRFDTSAQVIFGLDTYSSSSEVEAVVEKLPYRSGHTNTSGALRVLRQEVFQKDKGDRPDVRNVGIIITDGVSTIATNETLKEAALVKEAGIRMFAVGLTNDISEEELTAIASYPTNEHYFNTTSFGNVAKLVSRLIWSVCHEPCLEAGDDEEDIDGYGTVCKRKLENICGVNQTLKWEAFPGQLLVGHNYARLTDINSVEDCQTACLVHAQCRSVDYVASAEECSVSYVTYRSAPLSFMEDPLVTYYEWHCMDIATVSVKTNEGVTDASGNPQQGGGGKTKDGSNGVRHVLNRWLSWVTFLVVLFTNVNVH